MSNPTPEQLGLPADAPVKQYEAALKAGGYGVNVGALPTETVVATPFPPPPSTSVPPPEEPVPEPDPTTPGPEVVATFRDPGGSLYTVTRS